ncbi:response regulator transcription factor HprR [Shimwellia blattae]|uniref:Heavy metal response regulator YedW n=1 Tax=Shimwellia blattae (strain ATCC 29907 / DSM 4481 / JCM 1650 / NBRC 105725 / CDC 9005-74) TaxID=630626 RepID=I2B7B4_SHIBC|nr:response regulator transcription factor HprR [Shimwellia blattae]AFJ46418.1 heavy metal response regulator YedW [Shimwellia blattae DSM 4481 = NBRC 105725]GAB79999.1 putative two-component response regulator YedW [Shimwellia blattae DSM 4481 = NBRC 105725]VDY63885.1 Probable transcriptional regulatory protein YedW [Shimwellia blattae]VEC22022.1 Probable transcriptional regulatory protein YedW [Shimwellia blattae]
MKILVIEDNKRNCDWISKGLTEAGYIVDIARDGRDGLYLALEHNYGLIILDIMLPGMDGWQVLEALRPLRDTPVICLTARDAVADRVRGLESGANDYLVKPFAFAELLARVRNQLRQHPQAGPCIMLADLTINSLHQTVLRQGQPIALTRREFALLWLLACRADEIVPRTLIASEVWGINFDSDTNTVDVAIRRLRRKVDDPFSQKLITTVRGMGYRLAVS